MSTFSSLKKLLSPSPLRAAAHAVYLAAVAQSRQPFFYRQYGLPDTLDGRFDVIVLHLFMMVHRLRGETAEEAGEFIRELTEIFFADMDRSLREMGVGDTGVGKRVKQMAQAFYGRLNAYEQGMAAPEAMQAALKRNLYREGDVSPEQLRAVADYVGRNVSALARQDAAALLGGAADFLD